MKTCLVKKIYLFTISFLILNFAQAQSKCASLFQTYRGDTDSIKMIPADFAASFGQLSSTQKQFDKKWNHYYSTSIYRGDVSKGRLDLDEVISYFIKPKEATTGNGATISNLGVQKAFKKYNKSFDNMGNFFANLRSHHVGDPRGNYWQTLMLSWSTLESLSQSYTGPDQTINFATDQRTAYDVHLKSVQPKTGLNASLIAAEHNYQYTFHNEKEISIVGGVDPEMIQEGIFHDFKKDGYGDFYIPINGLAYVAKRISFNKIEITEYRARSRILEFGKKPDATKVANYDVRIKPDGSYKIFQKGLGYAD